MALATEYLTAKHLQGFDRYKYNAIDTNPISVYVLHPFWNTVVKLCPRWLAPNALTFSGFMMTVANFAILSYYDYDFYASNDGRLEVKSIPNWVWLFIATNHFLAHTLDGIDGKQARRTNTSGPLGEMFDHGMDSWATLIIPSVVYSVFGRDDPIHSFRFYFIIINVHLNFIFSHWEKYNTGILYLPWGYDLSQVVLFIVYVTTFLSGYEMWKSPIPYIDMAPSVIMEFGLHAGSIGMCLPVSVYNIYVSYRDGTGKMRPFGEAMRPLYSTAIFFCMCFAWIYLSPSNIIEQEPRCFYLLTGTLFSNICCRLIISQMTDTRCEAVHWMLFPMGGAMLVVTVLPATAASEVLVLRLLTLFVTIAHIHYGVCVVRQLCRHFNVYCFRIKREGED